MVRFKGLDLNLLGVFDVLMRTRSVSAAARQMNLSQPAMSSALSRLREFFGDPILVVQGKRMYPTAFAEALIPQVRACLHEVEGLLATSSAFDPATSHRTFRLIASDYIVTAAVVPLVERLAREAPRVRLELTLPGADSGAQIGEGRADLYISPEQFMLTAAFHRNRDGQVPNVVGKIFEQCHGDQPSERRLRVGRCLGKIEPKSMLPSPSERNRPGRSIHDWYPP